MDITHHYIEAGKGDTLILLHGNGENSEYFSEQISFFSRFFHVIAIDTRGHGKTPRGEGEFSIRRFADDLLDFMDIHTIEKAHILGFSDGGNIALVFAMRYPERVEKLILNGANLYSSGVKLSVQLPIIIGYHIASLFSGRSEKAKRNAEMLGLMAKDPGLRSDELSAVKAQTLVIAGTRDMIKGAHTRMIAESIAGAKLIFIRGDHFIASNNPDDFNKAVGEFLLSNN